MHGIPYEMIFLQVYSTEIGGIADALDEPSAPAIRVTADIDSVSAMETRACK